MLMTARNAEAYETMPRRGVAPRTRGDRSHLHAVMPQTQYQAQPQARPVNVARHQLLHALAAMSIIVVVFTVCAGLIYFKCLISATQLEINDIQENIEQMTNDNSRLQAVTQEAINLNNIRLEAQKLGMGYPDSDQIRYVSGTSASLDTQQEQGTSIQN